MLIFDTDILVWVERNHPKAIDWVDQNQARAISAQTYMELLQGARSKQEQRDIRNFLQDFDFQVLPFSENISHRAAIYIEDHALTHGIKAGDALIAATAMEHNLELASGNAKHFQCISGLKLRIFKVC